MKNKTKLVLGLAAMLGVTAAAGTTSGFAWFTTTRTATVNFDNAVVYNKAADLSITYSPITNGGVTSSASSVTGNSFVLTGNTSPITDISGNGATFYRPTWQPGQDGIIATACPTVSNTSSVFYYVQFGVTFTNNGTKAANVYLDSGSSVAAGGTATATDIQAAKATRVSVYEGSTLMTIWQDDKTDTLTGYQYISSATGTAYTSYATLSAPDSATFHEGAFASVITGFTPANGQLVASLDAAGGTKPSTMLTFTLWIEGTLSTAVNAAIGGKVQTALHFAAL
jgi:hypothetical protein